MVYDVLEQIVQTARIIIYVYKEPGLYQNIIKIWTTKNLPWRVYILNFTLGTLKIVNKYYTNQFWVPRLDKTGIRGKGRFVHPKNLTRGRFVWISEI